MMAWTPDLIKLFEEMKLGINSSPVLSRFNYQKPTFLKTDWSAEGTDWIIIQPANDNKYTMENEHLLKKGECKFDLTNHGTRLQPIPFGSRSCDNVERKFHSFTGEAAAGRWEIG